VPTTDSAGPRGALVLVVDDDVALLGLMSRWLADWGYEVLTAESGPDAIRIAEHQLPDLVLLDILLPGMNGFEVCAEFLLRPALAHAPIIMITGLQDRHNWVRALEAGATDLLIKPIDEHTLRDHVRRALLRPKG
jgi:two-component system cell cycle response regulator